MALKLMYITNRPEIARIAEASGVDRIFVDMEYIGKSARQGGMDTVQSRHTVEDIQRLRSCVTESELLVRINPIHDRTDDYTSSEEEIDAVIDSGADIIMLPYFKTAAEVARFIRRVNKRARTMLLVETPEAVENLDDILSIEGIDEVHIGINDLSLGYGKSFMFELLGDGTVEQICGKCREYGIEYGFGGIAGLGRGSLPAEKVIMEHYRIGSVRAILSRSFCNTDIVTDLNEVAAIFDVGLKQIRAYEEYCARHPEDWETNRREVAEITNKIASGVGI